MRAAAPCDDRAVRVWCAPQPFGESWIELQEKDAKELEKVREAGEGKTSGEERERYEKEYRDCELSSERLGELLVEGRRR